ncbi:TPA: Ig-like domain-containing protein [Pseudomonas aeruginosa]
MGLTIVLTPTPASLAALNEQSTILATVTDYDGNNAGKDVTINWTTTDGTLSAATSTTDANGLTSVVLTSSRTLGGATVTATSPKEGGTGQITVPFTDKWVATGATYSAWQNNGGPYSCSAWTPDPATVAAGTIFTQSASCYQNQFAYQQNREVSLVTGQVRNSGNAFAIYQTVGVTANQQAVGTKQVAPTCQWSSFSKYGVYATGWTHGVYSNGSSASDWQLWLGSGSSVGSLPDGTGTLTYGGRVYSVGQFRDSGCLGGKNCSTTRMEYEACSVPQ